MLWTANSIASVTSGSSAQKAWSNSAGVAAIAVGSTSDLSKSRANRASAASPSVLTASMIGRTLSRNWLMSDSERRSRAARAGESSAARRWSETLSGMGKAPGDRSERGEGAAVDGEALAGDIARCVGQEVDGRTDEIVEGTEAPERDLLEHRLRPSRVGIEGFGQAGAEIA